MKLFKQLSTPILLLTATIIVVLLVIYSYSCFISRINNISNILLALLTATYVVFTYKILDSTRPRPLVFASLPASQEEVRLSIKNIGNRPAYNVEITIDPSLDTIVPTNQYKGSSTPMLKQSFMPPETEFSNFITAPIYVLDRKKEETDFKISIRY